VCYVKQKGAWAVFASSAEALESAPADPGPAIAGLTKKYLLSVRASVLSIPAARRKEEVKRLQDNVRGQLASGGVPITASDDLAATAAGVSRFWGYLHLPDLSESLDTLEIGVGLEPSSKSLFVDFEARGVEGSELARKFAVPKSVKTDFAGFALPGAAMSLLSAGTSDDEDTASVEALLFYCKMSVDDLLLANRALLARLLDKEDMVTNLLDAAAKAAELKPSDLAMAVVLDDRPAAIVGVRIAAGAKLEPTIKKLVAEVAKQHPQMAPLVKLDAEKYEGVTFHVVKIPVGADAEAVKVFGESVEIVVGTSEAKMYVGAGKDPIGRIKKAIDVSKASPQQAIDPLEIVISDAPAAEFFAKVRTDSRWRPMPRRASPGPPRCWPSRAARIMSGST
jgi:hypothetical protein